MPETFYGLVGVRPEVLVGGEKGEPGRQEINLDGNAGSIELHDSSGARRMLLNPQTGVVIRDSAGRDSIALDGNAGSIEAGSIRLYDSSGARNMFFDPNAGAGGAYSALFLGENKAGLLSIRNSAGRNSIALDGNAGSIRLYDSSGARNIVLSPNAGAGGAYSAFVLGENKNGLLSIRNSAGREVILLDGATNRMVMRNTAAVDSLIFDGASGDIILANADCAEDFDISNSTEIEPGSVMVIEQEGKLKECDLPYDKRVAGIISGGGNYKPGLVLDKRKSVENRKSISLMGKVFCKVDAQSAPIDVGDLLTTSYTRGHAMKAVDPVKAFGSVIGKALRPLGEGNRGMIPVLVALQ